MARRTQDVPGRKQQLQLLEQLMAAKGLTREALALDIGKSASAAHRFFSNEVSDTKFGTYLDLCLPHVGFSDRSSFYDAVEAEVSGGIPGIRHCITIGATQTMWYSAFSTYRPGREGTLEGINLVYSSEALEIDDELADLVAITKRQVARRHIDIKDSTVLHIKDAEWPLLGESETRELRATLVPADYSVFYTLSTAVHGQNYRRQRLRRWKKGDVIPELSPALGINVTVFTRDGAFVMGRRSLKQGPRKGQLDVGAVEGFSVYKDLVDRDVAVEDGALFDVEYTASRALREEYGIQSDEIDKIVCFGFGYDLQYCQWNILANAHVNIAAGTLIERNKTAEQGDEFEEIYAVKGGPEAVFGFFADDAAPVWSCGLAAAFFAMMNIYGVKETEAAVEGLDLRRQDRLA